MAKRYRGIVRWFSSKKGYGFISPDETGKDVFLHYTGISMEGYKTLKPNDVVEYSIKDSPKGPIAVEVIVLESAPE